MHNAFFKAIEYTGSSWPSVFKDLYTDNLPFEYISQIKINFVDGRKWEIDVTQRDNQSEDAVLSSFEDFKDDIATVEFTVDVLKLKRLFFN